MVNKTCIKLNNSYFDSLAKAEFKKNESFYRQLANERVRESLEDRLNEAQLNKGYLESRLTIDDIPPDLLKRLVSLQINRIMRILKDRVVVENCYSKDMNKDALKRLVI